VDDEEGVRKLLHVRLTDCGYDVALADSGAEALRQARCLAPDLVVLDIGMPEMDGFAVCKALRKFCSAPVLFLTANNCLAAEAQSYETGGDDFVAKPFDVERLLLRIQARLRTERTAFVEQTQFRFGNLLIDLHTRTVRYADVEISTTAMEFSLLHELVLLHGGVGTFSHLVERVWNSDLGSKHRRIVQTHLFNLRKKLEAVGCSEFQIVSCVGIGYRAKADWGELARSGEA
jgi:DNA-binding response OmpR family regulator